LKEQLENLGHKVYVPKFPTPENQTLENWLKVFKKYKENLNKDSILIGHSIGCAFILSILEKIDVKIKASFLVAGFTGPIGNQYFDSINKTFTGKTFDWQKIKNNYKQFFIYHSDNDPYVPLPHAKNLAHNLSSELTIIKNAGHFNESSGYKKFEILLGDIKKTVN
jgi:predicted alpha/beta hydrolase family esterase